MGYTHQWRTQSKILDIDFKRILNDTVKIFPIINKMGIILSGPEGMGEYILNDTRISFNGKRKCGHKDRNIILNWPIINTKRTDQRNNILYDVNNNDNAWKNIRSCGGNCMYEPFVLEKINTRRPLINETDSITKQLPYFSSCKTSFKPYDVAVMMVLIIARHHLKNNIYITSDGNIDNWNDVTHIIKHFLNYDDIFYLDDR